MAAILTLFFWNQRSDTENVNLNVRPALSTPHPFRCSYSNRITTAALVGRHRRESLG